MQPKTPYDQPSTAVKFKFPWYPLAMILAAVTIPIAVSVYRHTHTLAEDVRVTTVWGADFKKTNRTLELGFRSDGLVVWREAAAEKKP